MDYYMIGNRIRQRRLSLGLTQGQLADIVDISYSFMGLLERGDRKPSVETLSNISEALKISMDYLVHGNSNVPFDTDTSDVLTSEQSERLQKIVNVLAANLDKWY